MKKYQVIYADPPWEYENFNYPTAKRGGRKEYPTMALREIEALPVLDMADVNCALFLWVTAPLLLEGIEVMQAWGFNYKTKAFCWVKTNSNSMGLFWGMGNMTRSNTEDCLLGVKGWDCWGNEVESDIEL